MLPPHTLLTRESIGAALQSYGATAVPPEQVEPRWATQAWTFPAGAIRVAVTQLTGP